MEGSLCELQNESFSISADYISQSLLHQQLNCVRSLIGIGVGVSEYAGNKKEKSLDQPEDAVHMNN